MVIPSLIVFRESGGPEKIPYVIDFVFLGKSLVSFLEP